MIKPDSYLTLQCLIIALEVEKHYKECYEFDPRPRLLQECREEDIQDLFTEIMER